MYVECRNTSKRYRVLLKAENLSWELGRTKEKRRRYIQHIYNGVCPMRGWAKNFQTVGVVRRC